MKLSDTLSEKTIIYPLNSNTKNGSMKELLDCLLRHNYLTATTKLYSFINEHDKFSNSAVGRGIAYHYSSSIEIKNPISVFGISRSGLKYDSPDLQKVHFILLILDSTKEPIEHRKLITRFQHFINEIDMKTKILSCDSPLEIMKNILDWEENYILNEKI